MEAQSYRTWKKQGPQAPVVTAHITVSGPLLPEILSLAVAYVLFFLSDVVRCLDGFTLGNVQLGHHVTVMLVVPMTFPLAPKHLIISLIPQIYLLYDQLLCYRTIDTLPARSRLLTVT